MVKVKKLLMLIIGSGTKTCFCFLNLQINEGCHSGIRIRVLG